MTIPSFLKEVKTQPQQNIPSFLKETKQESLNENQEDFMSEEEFEQAIQRSSARTFSRLGESIVGAPGDIASFITGLFGKEQNILPTSSKLKELSENLSSGYTKAETETEKKADELVSDIGSMLIPGSGNYNFAKVIGIPVVGNLVKEGLKYKNAGEKTQAYGKVGTMVALDLLSRNKGGVNKYAKNLYSKADELLPKGISINAQNLEKSLNNLEKTLNAGGVRATTKKALEKVSEIKNEIKNGKIDVKRLAAYRPSINEAIQELGGFQFEIPKKLKPAAIRNLNQVKNEVIGTLNQYGEKFNPEFLKYHKSANEVYAAIQRSNVIANFLKENIPYSPQSKAVQTLFSLAPYGATAALFKLTPATAIGATTGFAGYQGFKVLHRVMNSPTLRKYYLNILKESSAGNVPEATRNLKLLDKSMEDYTSS
jgi:hypothetical protein